MGYVAVKGGQQAIEASLKRIVRDRLASGKVLETSRLRDGLSALMDQVMSEASLWDPDLAALAVKQAQGSPEEAVFLLRAYRSTLPRNFVTGVLETSGLLVERRISACFKDIPGGQILGSSPDYTHRLLDFSLVEETDDQARAWMEAYRQSLERNFPETGQMDPESGTTLPQRNLRSLPKVVDYLRREGLLPLLKAEDTPPKDVTMEALSFPTCRSQRLQVLSRGQTGAVTSLAYVGLRGYGALHPTVGELRVGRLDVVLEDPLGEPGEEDSHYLGCLRITEVETLVPVVKDRGEGRKELEFTLGYGFCFGQNETKAIAMSLLDAGLEHPLEGVPIHQEEFVLSHIDSVESTGFISHLKLPHYVTFQAKLDAVRKTRRKTAEPQEAPE